MKKALITFSKYAEAALLSVCRTAIFKITGNLNFTNITPTPAAMAAKADELEQAISDANGGDRTAIAHKNVVLAAVILLLRDWAVYINLVSKGNVEMLTSSGLPLSKDPAPSHIEAPQNLRVEQGKALGSLILRFKAVKSASSYLFQKTNDPVTKDSVWESVVSSKAQFEFTDLEQGEKCWFRVVACGRRNQQAVSNEVSQYVMPRTENKAA